MSETDKRNALEQLKLDISIRMYNLGYLPQMNLISLTEDQLIEVARQVFEKEFEEKENKYNPLEQVEVVEAAGEVIREELKNK